MYYIYILPTTTLDHLFAFKEWLEDATLITRTQPTCARTFVFDFIKKKFKKNRLRNKIVSWSHGNWNL